MMNHQHLIRFFIVHRLLSSIVLHQQQFIELNKKKIISSNKLKKLQYKNQSPKKPDMIKETQKLRNLKIRLRRGE
jgi:murein L,D-transpeptidase YafK